MRLYSQYIKKWNGSLSTVSKLQFYNKYKSVFQLENYFIVIMDESLRQCLSCFRLFHSSEIATGRFFVIDMDVIESEYHFLLYCNCKVEI